MKTNISILVISTFLAVVFTSTVYAWDLPLNVDVFKIKFAHGGANSALNIRINKLNDVSIPEFSYYAQISRHAYVKNASPRIEAMFTAFPPDTGTSLTIGATSADSTWSMNTVEVFFNGSGISIGDTGYVSLSTLSGRTIPSTVGIDSVTWAWKVTKIGSTTQTPPLSIDTSYHGYYIVLDTPQQPMTEPWLEVLDYACDWAGGATSASGAINDIVNELYYSLDIIWHTEAEYISDDKFQLSGFLNDISYPPANFYMNCQDLSHATNVFVTSLGVPSCYRIIRPTPPATSFPTRHILAAGQINTYIYWSAHEFGLHQISDWGGKIIDSSFLVHTYGSPPPDPVANFQLQSGVNNYYGAFPDTYRMLFLETYYEQLSTTYYTEIYE